MRFSGGTLTDVFHVGRDASESFGKLGIVHRAGGIATYLDTTQWWYEVTPLPSLSVVLPRNRCSLVLIHGTVRTAKLGGGSMGRGAGTGIL